MHRRHPLLSLSVAAAAALATSKGVVGVFSFTSKRTNIVTGEKIARALFPTQQHKQLLPLFFLPIIRSFSSNTGAVRAESSTGSDSMNNVDPEYPGTAVIRLNNVLKRVSQLTKEDLNGEWESVRKKILWAGGLKDLTGAVPGEGYTGHAFNDYNHVDLTTMNDVVSDNQNDGSIKQIAVGNNLGNGIRVASIQGADIGAGGSWSTCANGCNIDPPQDVAHIQFQSRIAFKLVWVPNSDYSTFVLVDDNGDELARGTPVPGSGLPSLRQRQMNYRLVKNSKYSRVVDEIAAADNHCKIAS